MSEIKGKSVFMILYNYSDYDYSIIKIMSSLEDAFNHICILESDLLYECKMIEVSVPSDINKKIDLNDTINVCFISSGKYHKFCVCEDRPNGILSNYVIIPMIIE